VLYLYDTGTGMIVVVIFLVREYRRALNHRGRVESKALGWSILDCRPNTDFYPEHLVSLPKHETKLLKKGGVFITTLTETDRRPKSPKRTRGAESFEADVARTRTPQRGRFKSGRGAGRLF
jgi:hypothetical protein